MNRNIKPIKYYKGKYFIVFYDKSDEKFLYLFNNVREILNFQKKSITTENINLINVELYRALRRNGNLCKFLTGEIMRVYIVDVNDEFN